MPKQLEVEYEDSVSFSISLHGCDCKKVNIIRKERVIFLKHDEIQKENGLGLMNVTQDNFRDTIIMLQYFFLLILLAILLTLQLIHITVVGIVQCTLYCEIVNYLHVFDFISFLFAVAAKQINHHTTQQIFVFFSLLALCLLHIINHSWFSVVP